MIMIKKYISVTVLDGKYTVVVERDPKSGWFIGQCKELPAALSQGKSLEEFIFNIKEAIELAIVASDIRKVWIINERLEKRKKRPSYKRSLILTMQRHSITMADIVAEVRKVRQKLYDANKSDQKE